MQRVNNERKDSSVVLGKTTRTEVVSYFKDSGFPPVTSVLVYLSYWGEDLSVRWLGITNDISTPQKLRIEAKRHDYLIDPTVNEYEVAIKYLTEKLPETPRGFLEHDRVTIEELKLWQREPKKRGF